ncbi:hypothetical protein A1O3_08226 [Capronia epimyces CBS 606.96]|uniref:Cytochrome P450 oxidoreductase n=1 Tax=Capronia epimyces CBS 606.96 TaxID=1182542 RepID=W9XRI8_9EURO|nr:uncharacterized protein A1O3_08226 [Capronia epimyces CBS 606.96]EXJ79940.1 hypothetical protein A1O3_08226 [Capronia epimyces CBS 606.96]
MQSPLLRIGPTEVSFYSIDVYDAVHKVGSNLKFIKDPRTYGEFVQGGHPALFSIADPEEHARRRRLMGQLYNRSRMDNLRGLMNHVVGDFVQTLKRHQDRPLECVPACRALEADLISLFSFGESIGAVRAWSNGEPWNMVLKNDEKATWMPVFTSFPGLVSIWQSFEQWLFQRFGWQTTYAAAMSEWELWASRGLATALSSAKRNDNDTDADNDKSPKAFPNLISTLVRSGLHPQTALSEARENLGPGTDTTSATLAHILWALAHNPQYQNKLRQELSALGFPTDLKGLDEVPRLKASVKEGIRWTGAAAAMLPRIVPPEGVMLEGVFLPGGTTVTSSPIWYLRDQNAFPNPTYYNPYRWLTADGTALSDNQPLRDKYYIPFSKGANVCIGAQ